MPWLPGNWPDVTALVGLSLYKVLPTGEVGCRCVNTEQRLEMVQRDTQTPPEKAEFKCVEE